MLCIAKQQTSFVELPFGKTALHLDVCAAENSEQWQVLLRINFGLGEVCILVQIGEK